MSVHAGVVVAVLALLLPASASGDILYVNQPDGVVAIDSGTGSRSLFLPREGVTELLANADRSLLYAGVDDGTQLGVLAVDTASGSVVAAAELTAAPWSIALSRDETVLWVRDSRAFTVLDAQTLEPYEASHAVRRSGFVATSADGTLGYFVEIGLGGSIVAIDAGTLERVAEAGALYSASGRLAVHPDGKTVYNLGWEFGPFVQTTEFVPSDPLGARLHSLRPLGFDRFGSFQDIEFSSDGMQAFLTHNTGLLVVLDTTVPLMPVVDRLVEELDFSPQSIAVSTDATELFLTGSATEPPGIAVFDLQTDSIHRTIALDARPRAIVAGPGGSPAPTPVGIGAGSGGCQIHDAESGGLPLWFAVALGLGALARPRASRMRRDSATI